MSPTFFQVGKIRGYAQRQPPPGVGEMFGSCHRLRRGGCCPHVAPPLIDRNVFFLSRRNFAITLCDSHYVKKHGFGEYFCVMTQICTIIHLALGVSVLFCYAKWGIMFALGNPLSPNVMSMPTGCKLFIMVAFRFAGWDSPAPPPGCDFI